MFRGRKRKDATRKREKVKKKKNEKEIEREREREREVQRASVQRVCYVAFNLYSCEMLLARSRHLSTRTSIHEILIDSFYLFFQ